MPRWLRIVLSGAGFAAFGVAGLLLTLLVFPLLALRGGTQRERELRAQRVVQWTFRGYIRTVTALRILSLHVSGAEKVAAARPCVVVANHPTLLDVVMLVSQIPEIDVVAKQATLRNPFMMGVIRATGYVGNDDGRRVVEICAQRLREGRSVLIFPEGTRSPVRGLHPFQRGAARMALETGRPLVPVFIACDPPSLMRGQPWYEVPERAMRFTLEVADPVEPAELAPPGSARGAAARRITAALRDFYLKKLHTEGPRGKRDAVEGRDPRPGDRGAGA